MNRWLFFKHMSNDDLIVDYCLYLRDKKGHHVLAISRDHNLCNLAESQGAYNISCVVDILSIYKIL